MQRRIFAAILLLLSVCILIATPILAFTSSGNHLLAQVGIDVVTPAPTPASFIPKPQPPLQPVLTPHGPLPKVSATSFYLLDMDTGRVLADVNGEEVRPMASTTKMMTAIVAIQTGRLDQVITVKQDAVDEYLLHDGSNAGLQVGEQLTLKDLLYALMLPSGDDAAVAIADGLAGSEANFVHWMNLYAQRHHLYQTSFADPDGLNWRDSPDHYSTAADLTNLAAYAMRIPLFAQIVKTRTYTIAATAQHGPHQWQNTNTLLSTYPGMLGIKTGTTDAAGYCLVFSATRNGHHLVGTILNSATEGTRIQDTTKLLNWGFALPMQSPVE
jgi:D-alanyl-D-alanine carboxypeptidase (penicillin-binding protein 5/6)